MFACLCIREPPAVLHFEFQYCNYSPCTQSMQRLQNNDLSVAFEVWYRASLKGTWKEVAASKRKYAKVHLKLAELSGLVGM